MIPFRTLKPALKKSKTPLIWWGLGFLSSGALLFVVTLWMASAVYSERPAPAHLDASFEPVDVIVCLTGGRGRIRRALELHERKLGKYLFISGIDRQVQMKDILKEIRWKKPLDTNTVILDHVSTNTIENAEQVANYLERHGMTSVLLVTSSYHVRRSKFIFQHVLPRHVQLQLTWYEHEPFADDKWWKTFTGIGVTVTEFFKFYWAYVLLR